MTTPSLVDTAMLLLGAALATSDRTCAVICASDGAAIAWVALASLELVDASALGVEFEVSAADAAAVAAALSLVVLPDSPEPLRVVLSADAIRILSSARPLDGDREDGLVAPLLLDESAAGFVLEGALFATALDGTVDEIALCVRESDGAVDVWGG